MESLCYYCMTPTMAGKKCTVCGRPAVVFSQQADAGTLPPGTELDNGSVVVGARIGRGGFGITYRALDRETGKRIALKEFMPNHMVYRLPDGKEIAVIEGNEDIYLSSRKGFMREARVLNELRQHPNIVRVLFTVEENNTVYYGMEYLEGDNLAVWARNHYPKDLMPAKDACTVLLPIMDALAYCHSKGVLHRDISPDNILICTDKQGKPKPKLVDFGAAYVAIQDYTHTFPNVRKAYFSAVEQMSGSAKDQGSWSDVYSLCATIYYLITGKPPTSSIDILTGTGRLQPPSELGAHISEKAEDVLLHGMTLDYRKRIQTVKDFRTEFCEALGIHYTEHHEKNEHPQSTNPKGKDSEPKELPKEMPSSLSGYEDVKEMSVESPSTPGQKLFIRGLIYALLAAAFYGIGYYLRKEIGLLYGWLAFSCVLLICLLCSGSTPGMAAIGQYYIDREGKRNHARMIPLAFLNASPLGLLDGVFLLSGKEALSSRVCGLECKSRDQRVQSEGPKTSSEVGPDPKPSPRSEPVSSSQIRSSERSSSQSLAMATMKGIEGPMKSRILSICDGDVLGRNPQMAQVTVGGEDATVGRAHCRFVYARKKEKWGIVNLSSNGVAIDGNRIVEKEGKPTVIPDGAKVQIGKSTYIFKGNKKNRE